MRKSGVILILLLFMLGCKKSDPCTDIPDITIDFTYNSLIEEIHSISDTFELRSFFKEHPMVRDYFFQAPQYPSESAMLEDVMSLLKNPYLDTLYQETNRFFNEEQLSLELENAFKRIRSYYPEYKVPKVETVYSGFGSDIYFSDSLLIIGLDYYLGEEASFRPNVYDYLKSRLTPEHLVPQIVQFTSLKFNSTESGERTILDEMVYYGKALEFTKTILPCTADSLIMGYNSKSMASSLRSEGFLWSYFVDNALLYDKTPLNLTKYIDERPGIPEIDPICPGRIGQWIGWRIVQKFRDEKEPSFQAFMKLTDAGEVLMQSKYRPRNR